MNGNSYLPQTLSVSLPDFRHFRHGFHDFLSTERAQSHDLRKFAARAKNHTLIYDDLAYIVLHNSDNWRSNDLDLFTPTPIHRSYLVVAMEFAIFFLFGVRYGNLSRVEL